MQPSPVSTHLPDLAVFVPHAGREFGEAVCRNLGVTAFPHEEREFEDGEHKTRPLASVRGKDVYVVQSLAGDAAQSVNDKFCRLVFFLGALRDAGAARVTAVMPYLCYARKDRRSKPRDPVTTRYAAAILEAVGASCVVTLDVHNLAAYQNAFRIPAEHLEAKGLFAAYFAPLLEGQNLAVASPDPGGVKRAEALRETLQAKLRQPVGSVFLEKHRSAGVVTGEAVVGEVAAKTVIVVDDLVSSGTTLSRAAQACRARGAEAVYAAVTHGVFAEGANAVLAEAPLERLVITNTIPPRRIEPAVAQRKLVVLDAAPLVAEAIRRLHTGGSIVELLE
jgi:ribose-phosphate pyrophosphokinase